MVYFLLLFLSAFVSDKNIHNMCAKIVLDLECNHYIIDSKLWKSKSNNWDISLQTCADEVQEK